MNDNKFENQIKLWRKAKGLRRDEVGNIFGVTAQTVGRWESGVVPKDKYKSHICEVLGISVSDFFVNKENAFAARIKSERLKRGMSTKDVAEKIGYTNMSVFNWERGRAISECAKEDICTFFGIEVIG